MNNFIVEISEIDWDTDGEAIDLPKELTVSEDTLISKGYISDGNEREEVLDRLSDEYEKEEILDRVLDYLSDEYGFLICSFSAEVKKMPNKIQSFYIGCETGSGMEFKDEPSFIRALREKIREAARNGHTQFDVTIELAE